MHPIVQGRETRTLSGIRPHKATPILGRRHTDAGRKQVNGTAGVREGSPVVVCVCRGHRHEFIGVRRRPIARASTRVAGGHYDKHARVRQRHCGVVNRSRGDAVKPRRQRPAEVCDGRLYVIRPYPFESSTHSGSVRPFVAVVDAHGPDFHTLRYPEFLSSGHTRHGGPVSATVRGCGVSRVPSPSAAHSSSEIRVHAIDTAVDDVQVYVLLTGQRVLELKIRRPRSRSCSQRIRETHH